MAVQPFKAVGTASSNGRVAEWMDALELIQRDERLSAPSDMASAVRSISSRNKVQIVVTSEAAAHPAVLERETVSSANGDDSEDDLEVDLAKAALDTGTAAFDARDWEEADALLQEALQALQQLPAQQRAFCDTYALRYKLAVCAYSTQEPADAEQALMSVVQEPVSSSEHRQYVYHAAHLLSHLYIRTGQIDRARSECERALQGRRRLLGKNSEAALVSTALMAHIYVLLNNRARAKACLAMIPETRRDDIRKLVEASLGTKLEHPDSSLLETQSLSEESDITGQPTQSSPLESTDSLPMEQRCYGPVSSRISQWQPASPRHSYHASRLNRTGSESMRSVTVASLSSAEESSGSRPKEGARVYEDYSEDMEAYCATDMGAGEPPKSNAISRSSGLSRAEILRNLRCVPVDQIEEAVCNGDHSALASLLQKKKKSGSLRSKVQKALRSKRVGALHFAALFGEMEMARRLLSANFDINEVPELSSTRLTPLKFAIGARQVDMVAYLVAMGAKPIEPDSWSTLPGQLMDRSWLKNTMSVADREDLDQAPDRMIAILRIWLKHGWNVNAPYDASGRTILHQAVAFESGSYKWDSNLRATMTRFLCEHGADPTISDTKGNTPYDMAAVVDDQDLLVVLDQKLKRMNVDKRPPGLVELSAVTSIELSGGPSSPVELFDTSVRPFKHPVHDYNWTSR